jgi:adenylate cyclase
MPCVTEASTLSIFSELKRRNVIRVGAAYLAGSWLVVQLVNEIFPLFGFTDAHSRAVVIVLAIGFVPTLIVSWAFELTPEGLKRDAMVDDSFDRRPTRNLDRTIIVVLALALTLFAVDRFVFDPARDAEEIHAAAEAARTDARLESYGDRSIAVLAFADLSPAGDQEYFGDGIAEELLNLLAKVPELRVAARTSAFSFKDKIATVREIGEALNVVHVLEGSVRSAGDRLRVTAQLIEAKTDTHLWSETYDRELDDVFAIQDDIAAKVFDALKITLLGSSPTVERTRPDVLLLVQRAQHILRNLIADSYVPAIQLLKEAIELDPQYLPARIALMYAYTSAALTGAMDANEAIPLAKSTIESAAGVWPDRSEVLIARAWMKHVYEGDFVSAARDYSRALEIDPLRIKPGMGTFALALNRLGEAVAIAEFIVARDPLCAVCYINLVQAYQAAGNYELAEKTYIEARELGLASSRNMRTTHGFTLLLQGMPLQALTELDALGPGVAFEVRRLMGAAAALHMLDRQEEFEARFAELQRALGSDGRFERAFIDAVAGEMDAAFEGLAGLSELRIAWFDAPPLSNLKADPRWPEFAGRAGLLADPRSGIPFDVDLPDQRRH